ncbi:Carbamoyl-phosphate synthase [Trichinella spiralis]|uniref:Carbamoyl-phosphate synthase n=1 Tax=Trichinella spiralis TaxID=6334 RepID=A0ABR3KNE2_TRISP
MSEDGSGEGGDPRKRCSVMVGMSGAQATLAFALASALEDLSNGAQKRKHTSSEMFIEGEEVRIVVGYSGQHPGRRASSEVSTDTKEDSGAHGAAKTNVETENGAEMDVDEKVVEKKNRHRFVTVRFQHYHHHQQQQQTLTNTPP